MMESFKKNDTDIAGKRSYFAYVEDSKALYIRRPEKENQFFKYVHGGTLVFKKEVIKKLTFPKKNKSEDYGFMKKARKKGMKIYSTSKYNYAYFRRDSSHHTWQVEAEKFLEDALFVSYMDDCKSFVEKQINE